MRSISSKSAVLALLVTTCLTPHLTHAETIRESMEAAYESNPTLAAARAELRAVNDNVPQELSNWRPRLEANLLGGRAATRTEPFDQTFESSNPVRAELSLEQPIFRGGRTIAGTNRAENEVLSQRAV